MKVLENNPFNQLRLTVISVINKYLIDKDLVFLRKNKHFGIIIYGGALVSTRKQSISGMQRVRLAS